MKPLTTFSEKAPIRIVFAGNSNISLGACQQIYKQLHRALDRRQITITVISSSPFHTCYGLLQECITGSIEYQNLLLPLTECYPQATVICGKVVQNSIQKKEVQIELANGSYSTLGYDHLVDGDEYFTAASNARQEGGHNLTSLADVPGLRHKLMELVNNAASSRDKFAASRTLRVTVAGKGLAGVDIAVGIASTLQHLCKKAGLTQLKPTVYLVLSNAELYETVAFNRWLEKYIGERFYALGVRLIKAKQVARLNTDGAVLSDGSFINCSLVVNTGCGTYEPVVQGTRNKFGEHEAAGNWSAINYFAGAMPEPAAYRATIKQGRRLGSNIVAAICNKKQKPISLFSNMRNGSMGGSAAYFISGGLALKGPAAFFLRKWFMMKALPAGLRRICIKNLTDNYLQNADDLFVLSGRKTDFNVQVSL